MKATQTSDVEYKNKPDCPHRNLQKEYHLGAATGDYVCEDCGKSGFGRDWPERDKEKGKTS